MIELNYQVSTEMYFLFPFTQVIFNEVQLFACLVSSICLFLCRYTDKCKGIPNKNQQTQ